MKRELAIAYAKKELGEDQFNSNKSAVNAIITYYEDGYDAAMNEKYPSPASSVGVDWVKVKKDIHSQADKKYSTWQSVAHVGYNHMAFLNGGDYAITLLRTYLKSLPVSSHVGEVDWSTRSFNDTDFADLLFAQRDSDKAFHMLCSRESEAMGESFNQNDAEYIWHIAINWANKSPSFSKEDKGEEWVRVSEREPEHGVEVIGQSDEWINGDCNPEGKCICFLDDDGMWTISQWCMTHDEYHTRYSIKWWSDDMYNVESMKVIAAPTYWRNIPTPPNHS